jgi:uncharacterized membrane protein YdbT with pleckstrin-like domain
MSEPPEPDPDDVDAEAVQTAADEAADAFAATDDSNISWTKRWFFQLWLVAVFGGTVVLVALAASIGFLSFEVAVVATMNLSSALETLATGIVYLFFATTVIAILVVAPGQYLSAIARTLAAYEPPDDDE